MGVDEIALKKHHRQVALVLSDLERRCVIAVLDDRGKETLEKKNHFSLSCPLLSRQQSDACGAMVTL